MVMTSDKQPGTVLGNDRVTSIKGGTLVLIASVPGHLLIFYFLHQAIPESSVNDNIPQGPHALNKL